MAKKKTTAAETATDATTTDATTTDGPVAPALAPFTRLSCRAPRRELADAVARCQAICDTGSLCSVSSHVRVAPTTLGLRLRACSVDVEVEVEVPLEQPATGEGVCLHARTLADVLQRMAGPDVVIGPGPHDTVSLRCGSAHADLPQAVPLSDFPASDPLDAGVGLSVPGVDLLRALDRVAFAMSTDEARAELCGVLLSCEPRSDQAALLTLVATDGHRLSLATHELVTEGRAVPLRCILHRRGVVELRRLLDELGVDEDVTLLAGEKVTACNVGSVWLRIRRVEGEFPAYAQVIPQVFTGRAGLERAPLLAGLRFVAALSTSAVVTARLKLRGDGSSVLELVNPDKGTARYALELRAAEGLGAGVEVGLNLRYFREAIEAGRGDPQLRLAGEEAPLVVETDDDPGATWVVMPMRL